MKLDDLLKVAIEEQISGVMVYQENKYNIHQLVSGEYCISIRDDRTLFEELQFKLEAGETLREIFTSEGFDFSRAPER